MIDFTSEQKKEYVIFAAAPDKLAAVRNILSSVPHKWLIGFFEGKAEPSVIVSREDFNPIASAVAFNEVCWLRLMPATGSSGFRRASLVDFDTGQETEIGNLHIVESPAEGEAFTFDPTTGIFYTVS